MPAMRIAPFIRGGSEIPALASARVGACLQAMVGAGAMAQQIARKQAPTSKLKINDFFG